MPLIQIQSAQLALRVVELVGTCGKHVARKDNDQHEGW